MSQQRRVVSKKRRHLKRAAKGTKKPARKTAEVDVEATPRKASKKAPKKKDGASAKKKTKSKARSQQVEVSIPKPTAEEADVVSKMLSELRGIAKKLNRTSSMTCSDEEFRHKVEHLKNMCPPPKRCKVKVSRLPPEEMTEEYGYVVKERSLFEIVIANNLTDYETTHVLIHEWAHMLCWRPHHPLAGDHGGDWGVWYAHIWRQYFGVQ